MAQHKIAKSNVVSTSNEKMLKSFLKQTEDKLKHLYDDEPERKPHNYASNKEALAAVKKAKIKELKKVLLSTGKKSLTIGDAATVLIKTVAFTVIDNPGSDSSLAIYDYDEKIYSFGTKRLNVYIANLMNESSSRLINSMMMTLIGRADELAIYNPLPSYKLAVGNGIFNTLNRQLEDSTPEVTVTTKISTNYIPNAKAPKYKDNFTFESMINNLSNNIKEREELLKQICKSIITGHNVAPALFIILGAGGDGKSTFFTLIANVIGQSNVAYVNFSQINESDKMVESLNKKLVLGLDNDPDIYIRKTSILKSMASHETITYSRKYLNAISAPFTATVVQLVNSFPRFAETGSSIARRLVPFKAENSYYEMGTENRNVDSYIKDKALQEYVLCKILDEDFAPYCDDYNDYDKNITEDALNDEDLLSQFLSDMKDKGVLSEYNNAIPMNVLYAAYEDWTTSYSAGNKILSVRSFAIKASQTCAQFGYILSSAKQRSLQSTLINEGKFHKESFGSLAAGQYLSAALEDDSRSRVFRLIDSDKLESRQSVYRRVNRVSAIEYFGLNATVDEFKMFDTSNDVNLVSNEADAHTATEYGDETLHKFINIDPRVLSQFKNADKFSDYKELLIKLKNRYDTHQMNDMEIDKINQGLKLLKQVPSILESRTLITDAQQLELNESLSQKLEIAITFVSNILKIIQDE